MSRTIDQVPNGSLIYLDEYIEGVQTPTPYILLPKATGDNGRTILRLRASTQKRMHSSNLAVYEGCEMDLWLEDSTTGFLSRFDAKTLGALTTKALKQLDFESQEVVEIARSCFLLSYTEMGWTGTYDEGPNLYDTGIKVATGTRVCANDAGANVHWWLRSPYSRTDFRNVLTNGGASNTYASNTSVWARPALQVSSDTLVSDEGADVIYLLPDPDKPYRELKATMNVGTSEKRPSKVKVQASYDKVTEVSFQICNNAGDETPTWENVTPGVITTLTNETKETEDWEIGLKVYAKSNGRGKVYEPVVTFETDPE